MTPVINCTYLGIFDLLPLIFAPMRKTWVVLVVILSLPFTGRARIHWYPNNLMKLL